MTIQVINQEEQKFNQKKTGCLKFGELKVETETLIKGYQEM